MRPHRDRPRVLVMINGMHAGGKERRLVELLTYVQSRNAAELHLVLMSRDMHYPEVLELGIPVRYLIRGMRYDPRVFGRLVRLCRELRPDIIHTWDPMTSVYAGPVARILGIRFLCGMITNATGEVRAPSLRWLQSQVAFLCANVVAANSRAGLRAYRAPAAKSICVYNGFRTGRKGDLGDPGGIRARFRIPPGRVVVMVGEFADRKDYDTYLRAAVSILRGREDVAFLAVGGGPNEERCKAMIPAEWAGRVLFLGWQNDVESIVNVCDIGVLATNTAVHGEGISNAVLEYMALGKPVVATDSGGTSEIVLEGVTGYLVPGKNPAALAEKISEFLRDAEAARAFGVRGLRRVEEHFSMEAMGSTYVALYRRLAGGVAA